MPPANANPGRLMRRYWEAHDLILKALSTTTGPFSWEGEFYQYRAVNIWPRPIQQPTPPIWMTGMSVDTGSLAAERGHVGSARCSPEAWRNRCTMPIGSALEEGLRRADIIA